MLKRGKMVGWWIGEENGKESGGMIMNEGEVSRELGVKCDSQLRVKYDSKLRVKCNSFK